ncbi:MAG: carbohydrate kinase family protein [bacterium]|nr:carbohydrate kinase family protein [bacterium]
MYDVISIGSSLIHSHHFELTKASEGTLLCQKYGEKIEVDSFNVVTGGGASNTAVGFSRLGFRSAVISELGKDNFAQQLLVDLKNENVATELLIQEKKEQTGGSVILVGNDGGRTVMVHRGASSQLDPEDIAKAAIIQSCWVHLSSISGQADTLQYLLALFVQHQVRWSWNPGSAELKLIAEQKIQLEQINCEVLLLNQEEWQVVQELQHQLKAQVPMILVTDGARGVTVYDEGKAGQHHSAEEVSSVDDTGAGDAFGVGLVSARLLGKSAETSVRWGMANAASVVQAVGAKSGLLRRSQIERIER